MYSDPIADMLTRIRNALMVQHENVQIPHSKLKEELARVLKDEGYIADYAVVADPKKPYIKNIDIKLKYFGERRERRPVITGLQRVSKPGRRIYVGKSEIPWVLSGMGIAILTTNRGVMTGQQARRQGVGGEVLCYVW
ncbi:MAG: 30S ribosomal protein S8 [Phototrophicales bacterium]|nr:MAG: 30S ribosomal protein S8 [Phototrophicales bacterium]